MTQELKGKIQQEIAELEFKKEQVDARLKRLRKKWKPYEKIKLREMLHKNAIIYRSQIKILKKMR